MKEYLKHHGYLIFIDICLIIIAILAFMKFHTVQNIPVIFKLEDLGYKNEEVTMLSLKEYGTNGYLYEEITKSDDEIIKITFYDLYDKEYAHNLMLKKMIEIKKNEMNYLARINGANYVFNNLNNDNIIEHMYELTAYDSDYAYALYDDHNYPDIHYDENTLIFLKNSKLLMISFKTTFNVNEKFNDMINNILQNITFC